MARRTRQTTVELPGSADNAAWSRAAAWHWYLASTPHGKADRQNAKQNGAILTAAVACGRLLVGCWSLYGNRRGLYVLLPSGRHCATEDGCTWGQTRILSLSLGSCWQYADTSGICWEAGEDTAREFVRPFLPAHRQWSGRAVADMLSDIERRNADADRSRRMERKRERLNAFADSLPPLPADLEDFARRVCFGGREYAFGSRDTDGIACTACGGIHRGTDIAGWKQGSVQVCPATGRQVTVRKGAMRERQENARLMVVQAALSPDGKPSAVARHLSLRMEWNALESGAGSIVRFWEEVIKVFPQDGTGCSHILYRTGSGWWDTNQNMYQSGNGYCYPDLSALAGTAFRNMALGEAAARGWRLNWSILLRDWATDARAEYLIKGGFARLVADLTDWTCPIGLAVLQSAADQAGDTVRRGAQAVLGLSGQGVARLRQHGGGAYHLEWLRCAERCGMPLPDEVWDGLAEMKRRPHEFAFVARYLSPEKIYRYLEKQRPSFGRWDWLVATWRDTVDMGQRLGLDITSDKVLRPKNLRQRHDELAAVITAEADRLRAEEQEAKYPAVRPVCAAIRSLYAWEDGEYRVEVPEGVYAILREGKLLRHCVGSNERYFDRIASRESYILFLRRAATPDTPWYTMEVEPGGRVRQLRTLGDEEGKDRAEAKSALRRWRSAVLPRLGEAERARADASRQARLAEFDALRRGGNVIRNGRLAGRLLADVLEKDFEELNRDAR